MGFEANGVPGGGTPGGGDLTGTLIAGRIPVANGIKSLTSSDSTYVGGVLTLKGATSGNNIIVDSTNIGINTIGAISFSSTNGAVPIGANSVLTLNASSQLQSSGITPTKLNFLTDVTSNIQAQIDGKIGGSLTVNYLPIASGVKTLTDSRAYQSGNDFFIMSPGSNSYAQIGPAYFLARSSAPGVLAAFDLTPSLATFQYSGATAGGTIQITNGNMVVSHDTSVIISAPSVFLPDLTASTVLVLGGSKQILSSGITTTVLNYLTGTTSNIQVQIDGKMTNVMTQIGDMIQGTTAGAPVRIASVATGNVLLSGGVTTANLWGKVGLTTHVTGVLPQVNGGTGTATVSTQGSIPFQGASSAYVYDFTNFNYNSAIKTLNIYAIASTPGSGVIGYRVSTIDSIGIDITTGGGGINITNTSGAIPAIQIVNTGVGSGIVVDNTSGIAGSFSSKFYTAGLFAQTGSLAANNTADGVAIYRNFSLNAFTATGSMLYLSDDTAATGDFFTVIKQTVTKLAIKSTGVLQYIDGNQASGKVLTSDASGNATWQTGGGGTSYTFSTGLTNTGSTITANLSTGIAGGQSVIGGTAANNTLTISSTTNVSKGKILFGNSTYNEFNNRLGVGTTVPGAVLDVSIATGGTGFRILNSNATTTAGVDVGWYWSPVTNGTDTNLEVYEQNAASGLIKRDVYHKGGNRTFGPGSGNGDAKLHVIGTVKIEDGSQGVGKVFTSDANGLGTWGTAGLTNVMTTIGDIIQANTGGTPQRLGNSTTGTYLRSVSGGLNIWSTLVLPNTAAANQIFFATGANVMDSSAELTYTSSVGQFLVSKATTYLVNQLTNTSTGTTVTSEFRVNNGSTDTFFGLTSSGFTGSIAGVAIGASKAYIVASSGGLRVLGGSNSIFYVGLVNTIQLSVDGVSLTGSAANAGLDLKAGTSILAPFKFNSGTNKTVPGAGEMEYDGSNLFFTRSGTTRENILMTPSVNAVSPTAPDRTITTVINGTTYYIHAKTTNN